MTNFLKSKKKTNLVLILLLTCCFIQSIVIAKLHNSKDDKVYEVNLVEINREKDSIDHLQLKTDLSYIDQTLRNINQFFKSRKIPDLQIERLAKDSLSNYVYLAKVSNRYNQYLVDLENKLQEVPLGSPTDGYLSSSFGPRKNPIPKESQNLATKDSISHISQKSIVKNDKKPNQTSSIEKDQIQFHKGIDFGVNSGTDIRCTASGKVIFAGQKGGYGNCIIVQHNNGLTTLYAHLSQLLVETNDRVKSGEIIAKSGNTGRSTGPHLHYEVHKNKQPINPKLFLNY